MWKDLFHEGERLDCGLRGIGFDIAPDCLTSAPTGQISGFEQRRISGSSTPLWGEDEQDIRNIERCR